MAASRLTDQELRQQLQSLGENVGPVTPTTRPLLLKKLKKLQHSQQASPKTTKKPAPKTSTPTKAKRSPSRRLVGFSSDEEDGDSGSKGNRRQSVGRTTRRHNTDDSEQIITSVYDRTTRRDVVGRSTKTSDNSIDDTSHEEDSNSYTGPFQRGTYRFRSFRRRKDSPESEKDRSNVSQLESDKVKDEKPLNPDTDHAEMRDELDGAYRRKSTLLNTTAVILALLCVVMLFMYVYQSFPPHDSNLVKLPICSGNDQEGCIPSDNLSHIYANYLYDTLSINAGLIECELNETVTSKNISKDQLTEQIQRDYRKMESKKIEAIVNSTVKAISTNDWGMRLYDADGEVTENASLAHWIETTHSVKPMLCRIKESLSKVFNRFILAACVLSALLVIYFLVRHHWRKEEEHTRLMYMFVENIIDILRKHHNACKTDKELPPYLPIPHVRDMLIKPENRQKLAKTWQRAVRFLSANESRIRVESQRIAGEDFEVWRWIHITSPRHQTHKMTLMGSTKGKYWQGQAFENFQWAVNPPIISPTPCLKIRNMFDPEVELEEGWHVIIQDAILEKCTDTGANIVHIAVDKSSNEGCVYVKCDSHNSAGMAFKSLHGCWFDGRLVAVKYLTLKRYHQRFPVSLHATESLRPSGTSPTSLVTFNPEDQDDDDQDCNDSDTEV